MKTLDFRSDTVTQPGPAMRRAMAEAEVGDDIYGEDPTALRLEARVAELLGKDAALYFPTGTMANQASLRLHTEPGDTILGPRNCHILRYEGGAAAALSGVQIEMVGEGAAFSAEALSRAIVAGDTHRPGTRLLALENTHNAAGGIVVPLPLQRELAALARGAGMAVHLDGARLWNAAIASGESLEALAQPFDTVSVCLSKGLGAPMGSVVGCRGEAREALLRIRKRLGGAMRQIGIVAAAGLYALEHHFERLAEDHENASRFASGLRRLGFDLSGEPETNMVMFRVPDMKRFADESARQKLLINPIDAERLRVVTHLDVDRGDVDEALERLAACASS